MNKKRGLQELKARASPIFERNDRESLVAIAAESSPNASSDLALALTKDQSVAKACRWLAVIRRDFGEPVFQDFVKTETKKPINPSRPRS